METEQRTVRYDVWSLDVWGNENDGFNVNDRSCFERGMEFPTTHVVYNEGTEGEFSDDWLSDQQILETLQEIGFLSDKCTLADLTIDGESESSLYIEESANGFPICQLEHVRD